MSKARAALVLVVSVVGLSLTAIAPAHAAQSISPSSANNDASHVFTLSGLADTATEAVTIKLAGHPDIVGTVSDPDAGPLCSTMISDSDCGDTLDVTVNLTNAFPGAYDVVRTQTTSGLTSATTVTTLPKAYLVLAKPNVTSISPATRGQDSSSLITITGTGFAPNMTVSMGADTTVSNVNYVSGTSMTANVAVSPTAAVGPRDVTVTAGNGNTSTKTGALTIAAKPTLTSVTPAQGARGEGLTGVVFSGSGFVSGGDFAITIAGVTVSNVVVGSGGSTVTANLTIANDAAGGNRTVLVTNADGGRARLLNGFRIIAPPGAPAAVAAIAGDARATVAWNPPNDSGSSPVVSYTVTPSGGVAPVTVGPTVRSVVITGLVNGTSYTFDITAKNDDKGDGAKATTQAVTPKYATSLTAGANHVPAVSGDVTTISGVLKRTGTGTGIAGATIKLTVAPRSGSTTTQLLTTDANGAWSYPSRLVYTTYFAASYAGAFDTNKAGPPSFPVPVGTKITVSAPASSAVVHKTFVVKGSVSPNKPGSSIGVYDVTNGASRLLGRATVASNGTYSITSKGSLTPGHNYLLQVKIGSTTSNAAGASPKFVVKRR